MPSAGAPATAGQLDPLPEQPAGLDPTAVFIRQE